MELSLQDTVDRLRGRFHRLRKRRPKGVERGYALLGKEMGVAQATLYQFAHGDRVSLVTLQAIEAWCAHEEQTYGAVTPPAPSLV